MKLFIIGVLLTLAAWIIAWSPLTILDHHTFFPLWLGYVLTINGVSQLLLSTSLLKQMQWKFLYLFLFSIPFWWYFEFLDLFTDLWKYHTAQPVGPVEYAIRASIDFSTVLPAVLSTSFLFYHALHRINPIKSQTFSLSNKLLVTLLVLGIVSHILIMVIPHYAFPLLWLALAFVLVPVNYWLGIPSLLERTRKIQWTHIVAIGIATLFTGFWWEMWNFYSLPKWTYSIPIVGWYKVFEMPILGYTGYPFFGLEIYLYSHFVTKITNRLFSKKVIKLEI